MPWTVGVRLGIVLNQGGKGVITYGACPGTLDGQQAVKVEVVCAWAEGQASKRATARAREALTGLQAAMVEDMSTLCLHVFWHVVWPKFVVVSPRVPVVDEIFDSAPSAPTIRLLGENPSVTKGALEFVV